MTDAPILFVDIDGVLHPVGSREPVWFNRLPLLAQALGEPDLAHVQLVVSSDWRIAYTLDELRLRFPPDLRLRVVGTTPLEEAVKPRQWGAWAQRHPRQAQLMAWLDRHIGSLQHPWAALDDNPHQFIPHEPRLVSVHGVLGLQPEHVDAVRQLLARQAR